MADEVAELCQRLKSLEKPIEEEKQFIIKQLAQLLEDKIKNKDPKVLNQLALNGLTEDLTSIARLILYLREKYDLNFSDKWLYRCLSKKYKLDRSQNVEESQVVRLSDKYIEEHAEELQERIKEVTRGPAQDIKIKTKKDTIDLQGWKSLIALELVELAKKIDEDENVDPELEKEIAQRLRMVRDGRFATTHSHYEAIIAAVETTKSLTHAIAEEKRPLTIDEIDKNQKNCRECYCEGMPKDKCNCHCHRTTQEMTTKGLKWAIKHNPRLGEFDEKMKRLGNTDYEDICPFIKRLFTNPNMDTHLKKDDKMNILTNHINKDQCIRCEMFLDDHPDFFDTGK